MGIFHALQFPKIARPDAPPMFIPVLPGCCQAKCEFWSIGGCIVKAALLSVPRVEESLKAIHKALGR
jgi:hypothetical protein